MHPVLADVRASQLRLPRRQGSLLLPGFLGGVCSRSAGISTPRHDSATLISVLPVILCSCPSASGRMVSAWMFLWLYIRRYASPPHRTSPRQHTLPFACYRYLPLPSHKTLPRRVRTVCLLPLFCAAVCSSIHYFTAWLLALFIAMLGWLGVPYPSHREHAYLPRGKACGSAAILAWKGAGSGILSASAHLPGKTFAITHPGVLPGILRTIAALLYTCWLLLHLRPAALIAAGSMNVLKATWTFYGSRTFWPHVSTALCRIWRHGTPADAHSAGACRHGMLDIWRAAGSAGTQVRFSRAAGRATFWADDAGADVSAHGCDVIHLSLPPARRLPVRVRISGRRVCAGLFRVVYLRTFHTNSTVPCLLRCLPPSSFTISYLIKTPAVVHWRGQRVRCRVVARLRS